MTASGLSSTVALSRFVTAPTCSALAGKHMVIWGLGRHGGGLAAARFCTKHGATVTIVDQHSPALDSAEGEACAHYGWSPIISDGGVIADLDADFVVVSPAIPPRIIASHPFATPCMSAEGLFAGNHRGPRVLITGTKGKSTTAQVLAQLLGWPVAGNSWRPLLEALDTYGPDQAMVCELSSFQLHHCSLQGFSAAHGIITTLDADHLDWHETLADYHAAKMQCRAWCQRIACHDDLAHHLVTGQRLPPVQVQGDTLVADGLALAAVSEIPLLGAHNARNVALACTVARALGLSDEALRSRLTQVTPLPHRLQPVHRWRNIHFINDSIATNPMATVAALEATPQAIALILGGSPKGLDLSALVPAVQRYAASVHLIGAAAALFVEAFAGHDIQHQTHPDLPSAMDAAVAELVEQQHSCGSVLLSPACASFGMFRDFADRGDQFSALARSRWPDTLP